MTLLILDTDILSLFQYGDADVCRRAVAAEESVLAATVISVEEQLSGWYTELRRATTTAD